MLAHPAILLPAGANAKSGTNDNPSERKKTVPLGQSTIKISNSNKDGFNSMYCALQNLINDGLSNESIDIIMSSWRSNTSKKYNAYIKQWIEFGEKFNRDFQNAAIKDCLDFLTNIFEHDKNCSTIFCARSDLSLFINTGNNVELDKQQIVQKYLTVIFPLRPSLPKFTFTWDVRILLDYYRSQSSNNDLDLNILTFKTTTLLILLLCQRAETAYSLDLKYIKVEKDKIQIGFPSLLKQTRPGKHLKPETLKSYKTDLKICPVNVLQPYINKTKDFRRNEAKLFINFLRPHKRVGVKTISRWIK